MIDMVKRYDWTYGKNPNDLRYQIGLKTLGLDDRTLDIPIRSDI